MSRPLTTLRTGVRTALLPINRTYRPFFSNTDASKGRAAQWEPSLQLDALFPAKQQQDDNNDQDGEDDVPWMTTYSAFDPGSLRPLQHSGISLSVPTQPFLSTPDISTLENALPNTTTTTTTAVPIPSKPWPYYLPAFLQPKAGTTFEMMHRSTTSTARLKSTMHEIPPQRISVVQAVLYGVPAPEKFSYTDEIIPAGGATHRLLYGVRDREDSGEEVGGDGQVGKVIKIDKDGVVVVVREVDVLDAAKL